MVGDYISREAVLACRGDCYDNDGHLLYAVGTGDILRIPAADVAEVRHGRWEWDRRVEAYRCSSCRKHNADRTAYCPNCGARMDGGQEPPKEKS